MATEPRATRQNRLASERSPYLLQHATNPVDWFPWGDEAFELAAREDRPVFLSVGYSACHWCHVMERESFEDEATARLLSERFVSVKVDREERPDVDQIFQLAHQVLTERSGGWPLTVFLTPDRRPFFAGTYFPSEPRYGMPGFGDVLRAVDDAWRHRRAELLAQAEELTSVLGRLTALPPGAGGAGPEAGDLALASAALLRRADRVNGGFGRAPKFPNTMSLEVLLAAATVLGDEDARGHALLTLDRMARGGLYDHLGGGFARYSTDERWQVPHFEKMLYDNALLARLYLQGWRLLSEGAAPALRARLRAVVGETLGYVAREMTGPLGVFYSAQDADSEGEEGRFFAWTPEALERALGPEDAALAGAWFDVTRQGNWEHGQSVLWTPRALEDVARAAGTTPAELAAAVERARPALFEARERRPRPALDDKSLAGWNALMISALADAGATLGVGAWVDAARAALGAWRERAFEGGRLRHAIKGEEAYGEGYLDDYAGLACAALDVYEATFDPAALAFASDLGDALLARFHDPSTGMFYYSPSDGEVVLHRTRDPHDQAHPGGAGLAAEALLRLGELTGRARLHDAAKGLLDGLAGQLRENPLGLGTLVRAADRLVRGAIEVIVLGDPARDDARALLRAARAVHLPHRTIVCVRDEAEGLAHGLAPSLLEGRASGADGAAVAFVCRGFACEMPSRNASTLEATLRRAVRA